MDPIPFKGSNLILKGGPGEKDKIGEVAAEVVDMHVLAGELPGGVAVTISCWELSDLDLQRVLKDRTIWVLQLCKPNMNPPIGLQTNRPFSLDDNGQAI